MKNITNYDDLADRDIHNLLHPQTNITDLLKAGPQIIESGNGIRVKDAKGQTLIDGMAGLWCVNVGYGRKELSETLKLAAENLSYFHSFTGMSNPPEILLAEKLVGMAPGKLSKRWVPPWSRLQIVFVAIISANNHSVRYARPIVVTLRFYV